MPGRSGGRSTARPERRRPPQSARVRAAPATERGRRLLDPFCIDEPRPAEPHETSTERKFVDFFKSIDVEEREERLAMPAQEEKKFATTRETPKAGQQRINNDLGAVIVLGENEQRAGSERKKASAVRRKKFDKGNLLKPILGQKTGEWN